ncbi:hypothetical protein LTS18_011134, partial [Coniosporium uncinatum]
REAQHLLAREFVELVHGEVEAKKAEAEHRSLFGKKRLPKADEHDSETPGPVIGKLPTGVDLLLPRSLVEGQALAKVVWSVGLAQSRTEAHNHIMSGGLYIGRKSTENEELTFVPAKTLSNGANPVANHDMLIEGSLLVLRKGKKHIRVCKIVSDDEFAESGVAVPGLEPQSNTERASNK